MEILPENLKEPGAACCDLGIAAVICFHRGETGAARRHLAAAVPHAKRLGHRLISSLALARSLDREQDGALPEALAALTDAFDGDTEEIEEIEDLLADAVRLATETGDLSPRRRSRVAPRPSRPGRRSRTGRRTRCTAAACSTTTAPGCSPRRSATRRPAGRCRGRRHWRRRPGTSSTPTTATQARAAFTTAVEVYNALGAAADAARLQAAFRAHGIRRGPHAKHRRAQSGWDSLTATEIKIAAFVEEGLSNPEIAARLLLSRRTVATHVSHILKKLNVNSRIDIARESALRTIPPR